MNFKKFISGISALTIAASAFASMAVTANAAASAYNDAFTSGSASYTWSGNADQAVQSDGASSNGKGGSSYRIQGASNGRQRPAWTDVSSNALTGVIKVNLNLRMDSSYNSTSSTQTFKLLSETPTDANNDKTGKSILEFASVTSDNGYNSSYTFNGAGITSLDQGSSYSNGARNSSGWLNFDVLLNTNTKKFDITIKRITNDKAGDTYALGETVYSATNVDFMNDVSAFKSIFVFTARYPSYNGGQTWLDDISVKQLSVPTLALDSNAEMISTGASTTVNGTITKGTETDSVVTTASSDNADVSVSVTDETTTTPVITITSTGSDATTAKITVTTATTGAAADAAEVTTQTIDVAVGAVKYADVTINFVDASGNVLKTAETVSDQTVGLTYSATAEQLADIDPAVIGGIYYYCTLNSSSPTSVTVADGGSNLNLVFDKTEYTYEGTVTTNPNTTVTITGTSTTGTSINATPVSNYAGVATAILPAGTYTVNVSKTDYTADSGSLVIANGGANSASVVLSPVSGIVYSQTFDSSHVNLITGFSTGGGQRYNGGKYQMYNGTGTASFGTVAKYDKYTVTVPGIAITSLSTYKNRSASLSLMNGDDTVISLIAALEDTAGTFTSTTLSSGGTVYNNVGTAGDLEIVLDTTKASDNLSVTYNGKDYTFTTAVKSISGLRFSCPNGLYIALSSIRVTGENIPDAPSANLETAEWGADSSTGFTASGNVLTDVKGNSVYGYKATLDGNGYAYDTVKVFVTTLKGNTASKTYEDTTFSGDASGVEFFVISNVALNTAESRVYCE